jgi:primosomal protein N' (replication factor Y)
LEPSFDQFEKAQVVIGARSSYFAFYNLGFIIVDEEHEQTLNKSIPHRGITRDAAIVLATHQAKVLLFGYAKY